MVNRPMPYATWNPFRCNKIVEHYGEDFFDGKTLLEIGALGGDNGNTFAELGAIVTIQDAREKHVNDALKTYPHLTGYVHDLNEGLGTDDYFDIILHMGVLYHLESLQPLIDACRQCNHLILETRVCTSKKMVCYDIKRGGEESGDQSFTGKAIRPSVSMIESILKKQRFMYERVDDLDNIGDLHYKWIETEDKDKNVRISYRAFWFCKRKRYDTT